jgi:twitching motility protein PilT
MPTLPELLSTMVKLQGSDLHITTATPPQVRVHGKLTRLDLPDMNPAETKQLAYSVLTDAQKKRFEETLELDFSFGLKGLARFRCNMFNQRGSVGAVYRVIPETIRGFQELLLPPVIATLADRPRGLVLVTGPTGSGKSTTLAALVDYINRNRSAHVITIEDPIEFVHTNKKCLVNQRQVGEHTDSFKRALRAALREDPDIVLLGEMRDLETVSIAIETAETGHLVFGTLHTSSAPSTIDRIIDQYPADQQNQIRVMLSSSLRGVVCQMLCKKVGGGRVAALEVMFSVPAIANLIRESKIFQIPSIMQTGRKLGMCLLNDSLLKLAKDGAISAEEALAKSYDKATLTTLLQQNNVQVPATG